MTSLSSLELFCMQRGLKMTEQRRVVARVLSDSEDHPDVEEIYKRAQNLDPKISLATVYRTLKLFHDINVLEKHDFGEGRFRYEKIADDHHDHLIDIDTGKVIEFNNTEIEILKEKIAREMGYTLIDHKLELYGKPIKIKKKQD
jgi:Fur family transcriptional regulator, ferric uptake regulator